MIKLIECPRDAMQGIHEFIPTSKKVEYINSLLTVGFDTIDFGSFVSPKAIPQMADTAQVLDQLELSSSSSKLLAIVANLKGAEQAVSYPQIRYLGFPFSVSETFQQRNTNSSISESLERVKEIQALCVKHDKKLVVYLSMAFGNPYGDPWNADIVIEWAEKMASLGIDIISLADTTGVSTPENINYLFNAIIPSMKNVEIGAHLHTTPNTWREKVEAAINSGVVRIDAAIKGFGGCPMAADKLTGNMATENVLSYLNEKGMKHGLNEDAFRKATNLAVSVFPIQSVV